MPIGNRGVLASFSANHRVNGEQAKYIINGVVVIPSLDVIPGKSQAEVIDDAGLVTTVDVQDFEARTGDLLLPGDTPRSFTPDLNHIIEVTRGAEVLQFTVGHPNRNEAPFRPADAYRSLLRIHTRELNLPTPAPVEDEQDDDEDEEGP